MDEKFIIKKFKHGGIKSLVQKAVTMGINVSLISQEGPLVKLVHKNKIAIFKIGVVPLPRRMGDMTINKNLTKVILSEIGINTPKGVVATSFAQARRLIKKAVLNYPLIVKPLSGSLAIGVSWNIRSEKKLREAIDSLRKKGSKELPQFLVEEMFIGDEFRVLVLDKKVVSCVKKIPATLVGDGHSKISQLIASFNKTRRKGFEIKLDATAKNTLKINKLTLKSILPTNFHLKLRDNLNMSDGGRCVDCTEEICSHFKAICEKSAAILGLTYGGIDFMTKDISNKNSAYQILEVNPNPYYNMHEKPLVEGRGIDVSSRILKKLFS